MAPILSQSHIRAPEHVRRLCSAPLRRHVSSLNCLYDSVAANPECLQLLCVRLPQLRELAITVQLPPPPSVPLQFPSQLRALTVMLKPPRSPSADVAAEFNGALVVLASGLAKLEVLQLVIDALPPPRGWGAGCSLAPVALLSSLRSFRLAFCGSNPRVTDANIDELRALGHLQSLTVDRMDEALLCRLLAPPHTFRWQELGTGPPGPLYVSKNLAPLLAGLPLRRANICLLASMPRADFLASLAQLTVLRLEAAGSRHAETGRILQAVGECAQLRELCLCDNPSRGGFHFTNAQLGKCVARCPVFRSLSCISRLLWDHCPSSCRALCRTP